MGKNEDMVQMLTVKYVMDRSNVSQREASKAVEDFLSGRERNPLGARTAWREAKELYEYQPFSGSLNQEIVLGSAV